MRFHALRAAIVRIVLNRNMQQPKIDRFLTVREKKVWKAFPAFWDRIGGKYHPDADDDRSVHLYL